MWSTWVQSCFRSFLTGQSNIASCIYIKKIAPDTIFLFVGLLCCIYCRAVEDHTESKLSGGGLHRV